MIRACGTWIGGFAPKLDLRTEDLSQVLAPTLVVAGTDDPVGGLDVVRNLASAVSNGQVVAIENAGHLP